jgi:outer membrane protein assembly factor BamB
VRTSVVIWLILVAPALAADWPQLGNSPQHTGYSEESLRPPFQLKWNVQFQPERLYPAVQAVVADGRAYLGTENGSLYALNVADGAKLWRFPANEKEHVGPILQTAAFEAGKVFFASMDGCVYALEAKSGKPLWKFSSGLRTGFSTAVLLADGLVFAPNRGGMLFALRPSDGQPAWKIDLGCRLLQTPACNQERLYIAGMDMVLRALDAKTGQGLWKTEPIAGLALKDYWPVVHKGLVIVRPMGPWEAWAFEEATGKPVAIKIPGGITMNGAVAPPCVDSDGRLVTALGGGWCRLELPGGAVEEISEKQGKRGGYGNNDENMIAAACKGLIFVMHCEEGNAQFTGTYQMADKTWTPIRGPRWQNFTSNTQGGGASQAVIAGGAMFHVSLHGLRCFQGAER